MCQRGCPGLTVCIAVLAYMMHLVILSVNSHLIQEGKEPGLTVCIAVLAYMMHLVILSVNSHLIQEGKETFSIMQVFRRGFNYTIPLQSIPSWFQVHRSLAKYSVVVSSTPFPCKENNMNSNDAGFIGRRIEKVITGKSWEEVKVMDPLPQKENIDKQPAQMDPLSLVIKLGSTVQDQDDVWL